MKVSVKTKGFDEGRAVFLSAADRFDAVGTEVLLKFGQKTVEKLQRDIRSGKISPVKLDSSKPTLVDSGKYVNSYSARTLAPLQVTVRAEGMNDEMSNHDLGELLEYGSTTVQARPHLRPLKLWVEERLSKIGRETFNGLFGGR